MSFGLTADGLIIPTQVVIRENLNAVLRETFGASIDLGDKSILGQITGIISDHLASAWEALEAVHSSQNPDKASFAALDALCTLTGTFRPPASYSAVTLTLTGTPLTSVAAGSKASTVSTEQNFVTTASGEIAAADAWAALTIYVAGDRVTNSSNVYQATSSGTSAASGGPTHVVRSTAEVPVVIPADGTVDWVWVGGGTGVVDVAARAEETGEITAVAYDIAEIETAVGGWTDVVNLLDATPGREVATDGELRVLREQELASGGNGTINALRAEILAVEDVTAATVFENNTDFENSDGVPPHSVEVLVRGGEDQDVWDALLAGVVAGVRTFGGEEGTATDDEGTAHDVAFSRPEEIEISVDITVVYDEDLYPADGDDQIRAAIVAFGDRQATGKNVVSAALVAQAFLVTGVLDVTACLIDDAPGPVASTTIPISLRQLAVFDTSRIDVTSSAEVP